MMLRFSWLRPSWDKWVFVLSYFLLLSLLDALLPWEGIFMFLSWPLYVIPWDFVAAVVDVAFVYVLGALVLGGVKKWVMKRHRQNLHKSSSKRM